ncbi:MAG: ABC transporter ATP-binding protein [Pseudomonadota bacterium]
MQDAAAHIIQMRDVSFRWPGRDGFTLCIDDWSVPAGSTTLLIGPSGSGKSTLLSLICGIVAPRTGGVTVAGKDLAALSNAARDRARAEHIGVIFQMFNLLPYGSVIDNVTLPLNFARDRSRRTESAGGTAREARRLLTALGLDDEHIAKPAAQLSVGQQQRVAAARALIGAPELIVADEPTSALDRDRQGLFLDLLFSQVSEAGASLLMVSHDPSLGDRFDRVVTLSDVVGSATTP